MRPLQPPPFATPVSSASPRSSSASSSNRKRPRRRLDLSLPLSQRDRSLATPLSPTTSSSSCSCHHLNFSDLERIDHIGSSSGSTVYKVLHRPTGKLYALKVIYGNHEDSVHLQICCKIEILRDVDNPNVVRCHDMNDHNGQIQVLLEYMDKGSLEGIHIPDEPSLSNVTRQILSGLFCLHKRKIVHKDIKPSNLLINSKRAVKVADFGFSRILAEMDCCYLSMEIIGYMCPERINTDLNHGNDYDASAGDIWSLGVSILELYLGRFPFAVGKEDWATLMREICMSEPPEVPQTASREFREFVACCLQKDSAKRWTAAQLLRHPFILRHSSPSSSLT